jgi:hypothetical protein
MGQQKTVTDEILTREELAIRLSRTPKTIQEYVLNGALKVHRIGISPVFFWSEVLQAVASGKLRGRQPSGWFQRHRAARGPSHQIRKGGAQ